MIAYAGKLTNKSYVSESCIENVDDVDSKLDRVETYISKTNAKDELNIAIIDAITKATNDEDKTRKMKTKSSVLASTGKRAKTIKLLHN